MAPRIRLIVGLGNPTPSYANTRHNIGHRFVDFLAAEAGAPWRSERQVDLLRLPSFFGLDVDPPLLAARLGSFMNVSGPALQRLMEREHLNPAEVLIVFDDFAIPFGALRLRVSGSAGGHNGLGSVLDSLGTQELPRLRMGIGPLPSGCDPAAFVLNRFTASEERLLPQILSAAANGVRALCEFGRERAMSLINKHHVEENP